MRFSKTLLPAIFILSFIVGLVPNQSVNAVSATDWSAGRIADDIVFQNSNEMSIASIQAFLQSKLPSCDIRGERVSELGGGTRAQYGAANGNPAPFTCLTNYYEVPKTTPGTGVPVNNYGQYNSDGSTFIPAGAKSAAEIIKNVAIKYQLNPKVLIVKLATESPGPLTSDSWPFQRQYLYAMGSHCPDSGPNGSANCDANYSGFSLQMDSAGSLIRGYLDNMTQPWWTYKKPFQTNYVLWQVTERNCGGSNLYLQTKATAALYTYTPYQPNSAALNNMYGTGDTCSAYGNRNFWRVWNDWFGSTLDKVQYVQDQSSDAQYLLYDGKKQALTYDGLLAWGIDKLPLIKLSSAALDATPSASTPLTRYATIDGTGAQIFVDNGTYYDVTDSIKTSWGNFRNTQQAIIPWKVLDLLQFGGLLQNTVTYSDGQYLMEGGILYPFANSNMVRTWSRNNGDSSIMSSRYYSETPLSSTVVSKNLATVDGKRYLLDGNKSYSVPVSMSPLFDSWPSFMISSQSLGRYSGLGPLSPSIRQNGDSTSYIIDTGATKRIIPSTDVLNNVILPGSTQSVLSSDAAQQFAVNSSNVTSSFIKNSAGSVFLLNMGVKSVVAVETAAQLGITSSATLLSDALINTYATSGVSVGQLIQQPGDAGIYLADAGKKIPITQLAILNLISDNQRVTTLSPTDFAIIPLSTSTMTPYIQKNSTTEASILDGKKAYKLNTTDSINRETWNLPTITNVSATTYLYLTANKNSSNISSNIQAQNGEFCLVTKGRYCAEQSAMIFAWGLTDNTIFPSDTLLSFYNISRKGALTRFAVTNTGPQSPNIYTAIDGKLLKVDSPDILLNIGYAGESFTAIPSAQLTALSSAVAFNGFLVTNSSTDAHWVIDGGKKRLIPTNIYPYWGGQNLSVSSSYLEFFPQAQNVSRSVMGTDGSTIWGVDGSKKRAIATYPVYSAGWSVYTNISPYLFNLLPRGADIYNN
ncbi:MAG: hypothetical protein ACOH18_04440 [Candidatus Saccharimonadaceae bacterium]